MRCVSPWYNRPGWLGVKHQLIYLLTYPTLEFFIFLDYPFLFVSFSSGRTHASSLSTTEEQKKYLSLNILYEKKINKSPIVLKQRKELLRRLYPLMNKPFTCRLPDDSSIYTAELRAILLALKHVYYAKEKSFLILSISLSSLQSILNLKYDHPVLVQILELYTEWQEKGERLFSSGFPAMLALGEIRLQILQLRMPSMTTSRLSSSHSQT